MFWHVYCYIMIQTNKFIGEKTMKAISIIQNRTVRQISDFMDRMPGLVSFTAAVIIFAGFIG